MGTGRVARRGPEEELHLPPGFRFYPSDEELVVHYLCKKAASQPFAVPIIAEVDLYKFDPWDLPEKALFGEKEWYFFSPRDRKYPNGSRPNRAAGSGYWKATGTDKPISAFGGRQKVGVKKALVFYKGKAPKGIKTNWIMHEYRLADSGSKPSKRKGSLRLDDWVLCRIYKKLSSAQRAAAKEGSESSGLDDVLASLPEIEDAKLMSLPRLNSLKAQQDVKPSLSLMCSERNQQAYVNGRTSEVLQYPQTMLNSSLGLGYSQQLGMSVAGDADNKGLVQQNMGHFNLQEKIATQSSHGGRTGQDFPQLSIDQSSRPRDSPVSSSVDEEMAVPYFTSSSGQPASRGAFSRSDSLPFTFDGLPSLFGRFDSISALADGSYFTNMAGDYIQRPAQQ